MSTERGNGDERRNMQAAPATAEPSTRSAPRRLSPPAADQESVRHLLAGNHTNPHSILGAHPTTAQGVSGVVVRAMHPDATGIDVLVEGREGVPMEREAGSLFSVFLPNASAPLRYRLRFHFAGDAMRERDDPYRFLPTIGEIDAHLFAEGTHRRLWEKLGANRKSTRLNSSHSQISYAVFC